MRLRDLLQEAGVTPAFRDALKQFAQTGSPNDRVAFDRFSPAIKVERTLTKMLAAYPDLAIERVEVTGSSGCEFYAGTLIVHSDLGEREIRFNWDCKWKAQQEGWVDYFGFPDQTRAAREFGYDCFREWSEVAAPRDLATV